MNHLSQNLLYKKYLTNYLFDKQTKIFLIKHNNRSLTTEAFENINTKIKNN